MGTTAENLRVNEVMRSLAVNSSAHDFDEFLRISVKNLALLYRCKYAFVGKLLPCGNRVRTLAVWAGEGFSDNFEYDLKGTPCQDILNRALELIPRDAASLYPDDQMLADMGVESYFGSSLLSRDRSALGLVSVMNAEPMQPDEWAEPILSAYASRLAMELEARRDMQELQLFRHHLVSQVEERTKQIKIINEELESFNYSVSHDLRAPLRSVVGFSQALEEDCADELSDTAKGYLSRITQSAHRMGSLIDDLLELSRLGSQKLKVSSVNLAQLSHEVMADLQAVNTDRNVDFHCDLKGEVQADLGLLRVVMDNLLGNAVKYSLNKSSAVISVGSTEGEEGIVYYVKDNGAGFDMTYVAKLFCAFSRLHNDKEFEGSGVGLATVKRIIRRHGGRVWAKGEVGVGATFYFTLPVNPVSAGPSGYALV